MCGVDDCTQLSRVSSRLVCNQLTHDHLAFKVSTIFSKYIGTGETGEQNDCHSSCRSAERKMHWLNMYRFLEHICCNLAIDLTLAALHALC